MAQFDGRVAIITGGNRGIGAATARRFAEAGAAVVIADRQPEQGAAVVQAIEADGGTARFIQTDVTDPAATQYLAQATVDAFGRIDILVNNAGITKDATLRKMTLEQFDAVIDVNVRGVFNATQAVASHMVAGGYGRILNASSVVALHGNFGQTNYVASKAAVIGMTKTWARELGRKGITVNAVAPGFIQTDMLATVPAHVLELFEERTPVHRLGTVDDIASAYLFLASEAAGFITGIVLSVDGGLTL